MRSKIIEANEIVVDYLILEKVPANDRIMKLNVIDVFLAEHYRLKRIIAGMGLNSADSEDVLQNVSVKALKKKEKFKTEQEIIRWLIRVTINQCLHEHRRQRSFRNKTGEILQLQNNHLSGSVDKKAIISEEKELIRENLRKLDDSLLGPIVLRYFCDMDSKDIGEILEQKPTTIRSRLRRARLILAKGLMEKGVERK